MYPTAHLGANVFYPKSPSEFRFQFQEYKKTIDIKNTQILDMDNHAPLWGEPMYWTSKFYLLKYLPSLD